MTSSSLVASSTINHALVNMASTNYFNNDLKLMGVCLRIIGLKMVFKHSRLPNSLNIMRQDVSHSNNSLKIHLTLRSDECKFVLYSSFDIYIYFSSFFCPHWDLNLEPPISPFKPFMTKFCSFRSALLNIQINLCVCGFYACQIIPF